MTKKTLITIVVVLIVVVVALAFWVISRTWQGGAGGPSAYSAVYLATGDMYFGKLSWFPKPHMNDVWLLQRSTDEKNQPQLSIVPFTNAVQEPVDEVYFNPKQIVTWTRLKADSKFVKLFQDPESRKRAAQGAASQQPGQSAPTAPTPPITEPSPAKK